MLNVVEKTIAVQKTAELLRHGVDAPAILFQALQLLLSDGLYTEERQKAVFSLLLELHAERLMRKRTSDVIFSDLSQRVRLE